MMKEFLLAILFTALLALPSQATTVTLQDGSGGYAGEFDAELISFSNNEHIEGGSFKAAKANIYGIFYFDISSIPTNATVTSATVTFNVTETDNSGGNVALYKILDQNSTGAGSAMTWCGSVCDVFNNHATYNLKKAESSINWDTAADNITGSAVTSLISNSASIPIFYTGSLDFTITSVVQGWVTTPTSNVGLMTGVGNLGDPSIFMSGYLGSPPPLLSVTYTLPGIITTINKATINNATIN